MDFLLSHFLTFPYIQSSSPKAQKIFFNPSAKTNSNGHGQPGMGLLNI
jgi:hypothetical protein